MVAVPRVLLPRPNKATGRVKATVPATVTPVNRLRMAYGVASAPNSQQLFQHVPLGGPVGSGTMTWSVAFQMTGQHLPASTEYIVDIGQHTVNGGYGFRALATGASSIAFDGFYINGGGSAVTAASLTLNTNINIGTLYVVSYRLNIGATNTITRYVNGGAGTLTSASTGYTPRNTSTARWAMGGSMANTGIASAQCGAVNLLAFSCFETAALTDPEIVVMNTNYYNAMLKGTYWPQVVVGGTPRNPDWSYDAKDANPSGNTWKPVSGGSVNGDILTLAQATQLPVQTSLGIR